MKLLRCRPPWQYVARDGWRFLLPVLLAGVFALSLGWTFLGWVALGVAGFVAFFFRDPERAVPQSSSCVVSPADGRVVVITKEDFNPDLGFESQRISIFLSLLNVHVNRAPCDCKVEKVEYSAGRFLPAFKGEASEANEQNAIVLNTGEMRLEIKQIAGLLARRIVCWVKSGDVLERGQRIGLIRFGSRVDVTLPRTATVLVREGTRVKGGTTILARLAS